MAVDLNAIPDGSLYRVNYMDARGYEREEFIYREDLVDRLEEFTSQKLALNFIKVEE